MKNSGKKFEELFKKSCIEQGLDYTRLKDAGWQGEQTQRRFTSRNICDCIVFNGKTLLFAELKSRKSSLRFDELTQLKDLSPKHKPERNQLAGFVCELNGLWFFLSVTDIEYMSDNIGKKSFNSNDANEYGIAIDGVTPKGCRKARLNIKTIIFNNEITEGARQ